jgi:hypothetical protein
MPSPFSGSVASPAWGAAPTAAKSARLAAALSAQERAGAHVAANSRAKRKLAAEVVAGIGVGELGPVQGGQRLTAVGAASRHEVGQQSQGLAPAHRERRAVALDARGAEEVQAQHAISLVPVASDACGPGVAGDAAGVGPEKAHRRHSTVPGIALLRSDDWTAQRMIRRTHRERHPATLPV